jgi:hypothetical protein
MVKKQSLIRKTNRITAIIIVIAVSIIVTIVLSYYFIALLNNPPSTIISSHNKALDKFGIKEIYPTTIGGREWFINMDNPKNDGIFNPESPITRQPDGSWQIEGRQKIGKYNEEVRMNVNTTPGDKQWKNVEITGYAKVVQANPPNDSLDWYARGIRHNSKVPCEGTSLKGIIRVDGTVEWKKEIWHTGGYTDARDKAKATDSILGRWIGWKVVMYNINNDTAVKMKSYIDDKNNNNWRKVTDVIDNGGWFANSPDNIFYSANCGKAKDYIVTNSGPVVTFRSDNMIWDFKYLSVREIQPPSPP